MKKVAVFGNTGGGKSTLSKNLAELTGLPLYILDKIQYKSGGAKVPDPDFFQLHQQIMDEDRWIIEGFGDLKTLWPRLDRADTLVYIDLPLYVHFWLVTKRLAIGKFQPPAGWPENTPLLKSSLTSYRTLWLCHQFMTPKYREYIDRVKDTKNVYHLTSLDRVSQFLASIAIDR
jgi:adenylate kinase family enzyme